MKPLIRRGTLPQSLFSLSIWTRWARHSFLWVLYIMIECKHNGGLFFTKEVTNFTQSICLRMHRCVVAKYKVWFGVFGTCSRALSACTRALGSCTRALGAYSRALGTYLQAVEAYSQAAITISTAIMSSNSRYHRCYLAKHAWRIDIHDTVILPNIHYWHRIGWS